MKLFQLFITVILIGCLAACATPSGTSTPAAIQTPAKIAAHVCPAVQTTLDTLGLLVGLDPVVTADVAVADAASKLVCNVASKVTIPDLQTLSSKALPNLIAAVRGSTLTNDQKNAAILDLTAASVILNGAIQATAAQ